MRTETETQVRVWCGLAILLGLRLLSLGGYPLMDSTEARYAEISRLMLSLGDWVTPWYDHHIPFWGKPPLSFWTTAASFSLLGVNEFAARLPDFLAALGVGWLVWDWAMRHSKQQALAALALLAGCSLMLIAAGAVMTDMTLAVGTTLAMRGFWLGLHGDATRRQREAWLFFLGLAVGLLAKGPLVLVLAGLPLGLWTLFNRQLGRVWRDLPWIRGSLVVLLLVAPWYVAAEVRTPGFLDYFLMGEHWHRFVTPGWSGDRYGVAHSAPWGSIWVYAWAATLPWSLLLPLAWWRWRKADRAAGVAPLTVPAQDKPLQHYLVLWSLAPAVFFTFAGNILWTYVLPALPSLALLVAAWLSRRPDPRRVNRLLSLGLMLSAVLFAGFVVSLNLPQLEDLHTTKRLVAHYGALNTRHSALVFYPERPYSAAFYSRGQAEKISQASGLLPLMTGPPVFLAVKTGAVATLPVAVHSQLQWLAQHGDYTLFSIGTGVPPVPAPVP
ncbi:ArnT family glycosyltransferase [Rhodoferax sp. UBA5149]|uniref:ArnT family glycosyltransferase n=1 Tax=Rhodoferax sp. UBA5149 TaxID=1947379 RepID=UPI0025FC132B|nr:glycosyltransferase family 39 protein [Rhodoferax sp. UBA5149]